MRRITLSGKSEEIINALPKRWANAIINGVIAKSLNYKECLFDQIALFVSNEESEEIKKKLEHLIEKKEAFQKTSVKVIKEKKQKGEYKPIEVKNKDTLTKQEKIAIDAFTF